MLVIMLLMAVMSVAALAILERVDVDLRLVGQTRRVIEARTIADGAIMEVINDERTPDLLPDYAFPDLLSVFTPPNDSPYTDDTSSMSYSASIRLLRNVPLSESSQNWMRALVYEVSAVGTVDMERATSETRTQVFKAINVPQGTLLPRVHAR